MSEEKDILMKQNIIRKTVSYFGGICIVILLIVCIQKGCVYIEREQKIKELADYNLQVYNMLSYGPPVLIILYSQDHYIQLSSLMHGTHFLPFTSIV